MWVSHMLVCIYVGVRICGCAYMFGRLYMGVLRVIYKEIWVSIMMIEYTIFVRSNTILSDHNACLLTYSIIEEVLVKILLDQDDRARKFCQIICDFPRSYDRRSALQMTLIVVTEA